MASTRNIITAGFILLDANNSPIKDIEYQVVQVLNQEERHVVRGKTNSKGETYEFVKPIGSRICLYLKIGNQEFKRYNCLFLPAIKKKCIKD